MAQPAGHTRIPSRMPVYYAASLAEAEQAMQRISGAQVVAIDLEWKPNWGGGYNRTATVQLCDGRSCVVLHVFHMRRTPAALAQLLSDPAVLKVGAGISQDVDRVRDDLGVQLRTIADIQQLAMQLSGTDWYCEVCRSESTGQLTYDRDGMEVVGVISTWPLSGTPSAASGLSTTARACPRPPPPRGRHASPFRWA
eukprot:TRINITY_DN1083_c0_g1_i1.p1 TRINITY_DN1083_c0_g1~~TRINITY_DN1083_c0_g1_i1.p1  ORF type:complete len:196 (+),score=46.14 TRINITY_DN1083_c0_g1_i1:89-676(+)